jgi:SAM-dependent methyltransferase
MKTKLPAICNRVLKQADYAAFNVTTRKDWEVYMALSTLLDHAAVHPNAQILGAGAGRERTMFELSPYVKRVFATDIYLSAGHWNHWHGADFMRDPAAFAPDGVACDPQRITVQHADMCDLPFPDNTFDAVFSSGSIEHVGTEGTPDYSAIQKAASEIGRVVKPGGIISLSTEWKIAGDGWGWSHVRLFDESNIYDHIIDPTGCDPVDDPDWSFDGDLSEYVVLADIVNHGASEDGFALLKEHQFLYTSVHLALRKPV